MTRAEYEHADDSAYRLRALLRLIEDRARGLSEGSQTDDHRLPCNDIAQLCELAADLTETIHDMMQTLHQSVPS